ncbi:hypothetical protein DVR12_03910 [Chitinophaga silvatica]|uniref:OmpA-like domain-containing protein n=1 Tax=Chitinophaga silvatica TaxID=2282649 RepID=A0A3E1YI69_9BACT|nr:OmpA family protein [Chitinophaga silvatica]RFS26940.1 hypothetical protein DVR12_03910 [Chitinophaga silvatica]
MKSSILILLLLFSNFTFSQSVLQKLKQKTRSIEQQLDPLLGNPSREPSAGNSKPAAENSISSPEIASNPLQANTNYDFVPGTNVLLNDDFSQDETGQFPLKWYTRSSGEVVTFNGITGKWLRLFSGVFLSPTFTLPENCTIEFDLITSYSPTGGFLLPSLNIGLYDRGNKGYILSSDYTVKNKADIILAPYKSDLHVKLVSIEEAKKKIETDKYVFSDYAAKLGKPVHLAIDIQKERIRIWIDKEKVFDLPQAVPLDGGLNQLRIDMARSNYKNSELGYYFSNLRIAEGKADTRSKLLTEGKLESNTILFATNSSKIQSDNQGIIKEVAQVMKQNMDMRIQIIGHTDHDGRPETNLKLSQQRADAVKIELIQTYGIEAGRIQTTGKGDTMPITNDPGSEGKAKNRRVEFIKL